MHDDAFHPKGLAARIMHAQRPSREPGFTPHVVPVYQTTNFLYDSGEEMAREYREGWIYTRYANPTTEMLNATLAAWEGTEGAVAFSSGMAAISSALLSVVGQGEEVLASNRIYGGTFALLSQVLPRYGVTTRFCDLQDRAAAAAEVTGRTRALYFEPITNPTVDVLDVRGLVGFGRERDLAVVVDNTFAPPPMHQVAAAGPDLICHSATKYIGGHSDVIAGAVCASAPRLEAITPYSRYFGGTLSPHDAWLLLRGLKTQPLRLERQCRNAQALADFLAAHPRVARVDYPGLAAHPRHALAREQFRMGGAMLAFDVEGGLAASERVLNAFRLCARTVSLGDVETLVCHAATTSHFQLSPAERRAIGVTDGLIRVSVGIEEIDELVADFEQALAQA